MTNWRDLRDVYGSAAEVPALLDQAASVTDWDAPVWRELWGRLYHQGTVAPASYAALPSLARIAEARPNVALDPALFLAASIVASTDGPPEIAEVRDRYAAQIDSLRPVAEHKLDLAHERADVIYALQTLAAFEDLSIWQRHLESLVNEEVELECPSCDDHLYLVLLQGEFVVTTDPDVATGHGSVRPATPDALGPSEVRLFELCNAHNQDAVEKQLLHLFGDAGCPTCRTRFTIAAALS